MLPDERATEEQAYGPPDPFDVAVLKQGEEGGRISAARFEAPKRAQQPRSRRGNPRPTTPRFLPPDMYPVPSPRPRSTVAGPRRAGRPYLEDPRERRLYVFRALGTTVGLILLAVALLWALGELGNVWGTFLDLFRRAPEASSAITPG
ncbi:MAG: hypothetical protein ACE5KX_06870 [Acidimicrobiia bacterium]